MSALQPPDSMYLESAKGWYLLGNLKEADLELDRIQPEFRLHPDVLEVRFAIYSRSKNWQICMEIASAMLSVASDRPTAWINSAIVLHAFKDTDAAWKTLFRIKDRFPKTPLIPYNLACYAAALGRFSDSCQMLEQAIRLGGEEFAEFAKEDPDLNPLWHKIEWHPGQSSFEKDIGQNRT